MQGVEQAYCDACARGLLSANVHLLETTVGEAIGPASNYGKGDTLALDAIPEIAINTELLRFDPRSILITEELGSQLAARIDANAQEPLTLFFCDPTDRSKALREFLSKNDPSKTVKEVLRDTGAIARWEEHHGAPVRITGAVTAITCIRENLPVFTLILNYVTQELILVHKGGVKTWKLPDHDSPSYEKVTTELLLNDGREIKFLPLNDRKTSYADFQTYVTFLGKAGYPENLRDCSFFPSGKDASMKKPFFDSPGGPTRFLYLSDYFPHSSPHFPNSIGFILANGEKSVEWVHWLTALRFATMDGEKALQLFEITHDRPWTREGISMAPSPAYSIFRANGNGLMRIDARPLWSLSRPSQYRATLVLAPSDNTWMNQVMQRSQHREIRFD